MNPSLAARDLRKAADVIEQGYWYRGLGADNDEPIWVLPGNLVTKNRSDPRMYHMEGGCLANTLYEPAAINALKQHLNKEGIFDLFELNDAQPLETGRQWAIDTLRAAADAVEEKANGAASR